MDKERAKTKEIGDFQEETGVASATEMTGLIPSMPATNDEKENYGQIIRYKRSAERKNEKDRL